MKNYIRFLLFLTISFVTSFRQTDQSDTPLENNPTDENNSTVEQITYTCILLSRYQLQFYGDQLVDIVKNQENLEEKNQVWKKMYAGHVIHCLSKMTHEQSLELLNDLTVQNVELKKYFKVYDGFDMDIFKTNKWSKEIVAEEERLWKLIEDFESALSEKKQDQKKKDKELDDIEYLKSAANQRAINLKNKQNDKDSSNFYDVAVLISVFGAIGFLLFTGYQKVAKNERESMKKSKKNQ